MVTLIILSAIGVVALFSEIFNFKKIMLPLIMIGLAGAFVADMMDWNHPQTWNSLNRMMATDNYSVAFTGLMILITFIWFIMSPSFFKEISSRTDHFALIIFALVGAQLMTSFSNMLMLFL